MQRNTENAGEAERPRSLSARESRHGGRQITALPPSVPSKKSLGGLFYFLMAKINITYRENEWGAPCNNLVATILNILGREKILQQKTFATTPRIPVITILTPVKTAGGSGVGEPKELDRKAKLVADSSSRREPAKHEKRKKGSCT